MNDEQKKNVPTNEQGGQKATEVSEGAKKENSKTESKVQSTEDNNGESKPSTGDGDNNSSDDNIGDSVFDALRVRRERKARRKAKKGF